MVTRHRRQRWLGGPSFRVVIAVIVVYSLVVGAVGPAPTAAAATTGHEDRPLVTPAAERTPLIAPSHAWPVEGVDPSTDIDPDEIDLEITLRDDGSAEWQLQLLVVLETDEDRQAFEEFESDVDDDPDAYVDRFADRIAGLRETAAASTGREMHTYSFSVDTDRQSLATEYGVVTYGFTWDGFAAVDGAEIHAGDAIDRYYLDDDSRLTMRWSEPFEARSVSPDPDERRVHAVSWRGTETDFVSGEPRVVLTPAGSSGGVSTLVAGGLAGAVAVVLAAWWWRTRRATTRTPLATSDESERSRDPSSEASSSPTGDDSSTDSEEGTPADGESTTDGPDPTDPDAYLSNEERVLALLEAHDGRLKQQQVVEQLGWTDARTSQVVSGLREEGKLESFRLGRENVLTLAGENDK